MSINVHIPFLLRRLFKGSAIAGPALLVALFANTARAQQAADDTFPSVTLEQAVSAALKHSPQVTQAIGSVETGAAAERSAFGSYLPNLSISSRTGYSSNSYNAATNTASPTNTSLSAGVNLSYDLFTGLRRGAEMNSAQAQSRAARAGLISARADLAYTVEAAFYDALRARELVGVAEARKVRAQTNLEAAQKRFAAGSATKSDVLRAQLELNTAEQAVLEQKTAARTAGFALGRYLGVNGGVSPSAEASQTVELSTPAQLDGIVDRLVRDAPVVKAAEAQVDSSSAQKAAANSRYLPTLSMSAGYDQSFVGRVGGGWSVGLNLSYPIFDGFQREESVARARVAERNASSQLEDTRRMVRAEAERAVASVTLAQQKVALARQSVEVAREDLRVQDERYKLGAATMLDLLTSQTGLVEAENNLITARFDYELSKASLAALAGEAS